MPNPDPATRQPRARAPTRGPLAPRLLVALLTPGPILAALAALTGSATLRGLTATLATHALIAQGPTTLGKLLLIGRNTLLIAFTVIVGRGAWRAARPVSRSPLGASSSDPAVSAVQRV